MRPAATAVMHRRSLARESAPDEHAREHQRDITPEGTPVARDASHDESDDRPDETPPCEEQAPDPVSFLQSHVTAFHVRFLSLTRENAPWSPDIPQEGG